VISEEVVRVDVHAANHARHPKLDDAPVEARYSLSPRLPAVHPLSVLGELVGNEDAAAGLEQILLPGEKLVARFERPSARLLGSEIGQASEGNLEIFVDVSCHVFSRNTLWPSAFFATFPRSYTFWPRTKVAITFP